MRVVVVGLGVQGRKRGAVAGPDLVATVDPVVPDAAVKSLEALDVASYDAALLCVPDAAKAKLVRALIEAGKHVLVEKPLVLDCDADYAEFGEIAAARRIACYVAYNHRFEPHFMRMRDLIGSGELGRIYRCRMFYGNGTARDVRGSPWRDDGAGVLHDLGSHLLDTAHFWFGHLDQDFRILSARRYENRAFDHVVVGGSGEPDLEFEMTLLSWRNHFQCDVFGEHGSAHIQSLCKWGPSTFMRRTRKLPSGRPDEVATILVQDDPTWAAEYAHFKVLCGNGRTDLSRDRMIGARLRALGDEAIGRAR